MTEIMVDASKEHAGTASQSQHTAVGKHGSRLPLLDRLSATRGVWELLDVQPEQVKRLLSSHQPGSFIIARNGNEGSRTLFLRNPGSENEAVCLFPLEESSAVHLKGSQLYFRNLLELVGFHFVSRDILPCLLRIPHIFQLPCRADLDAVATLGTTFWTMPLKPGDCLASNEAEASSAEPNGDLLKSRQPSCSIRVTSENAALCIVNPLFLSVHSDIEWLDLAPSLCRSSSKRGSLQLSNGLAKQEGPVSLKHLGSLEKEEEMVKDPLSCSASARRKFLSRRPSWNSSETEEPPWSPILPQKEIRSPHRVSWVEGISADALPCWPLQKAHSESLLLNDSMLLPLIPELDSLSVSSVEDEGEGLPPATPSSQKRPRSSSSTFTHKVLYRLSAMSNALTGFLSLERRVSKRVQELAQESTSVVGGLVHNFVGHILRGAGTRHPTSTEMLQEIRQMISNLKGYLCESSDLHTAYSEYGEAEEIDLGSVVEGALYKCILKPLRDSIYAQLLDFRTHDGTLNRLRENQVTLSQQSLGELGVAASVPDGACLERIQTKLSLLHQAYSPKKKETQMLKICKMLYEAMNLSCDKAEPFGADDFLPVLIYVLVHCDVVSVQLDVEYMMELMDPSQLQGEGGYYLTTWFGALYHIENFQAASTITRQISVEAKRSIHQWHRRRTIHHHRRNLQNILYVSFHEPFNNQKTISVPPNMTTALVCAACAEKYGISDGADYGLFLVSESSSELLTEDSYPQKIRADLLQSQGGRGNFVYKPKDRPLPAFGSSLLQEAVSLTESHKPLESVGVEQSEVD
ncbi:ras and Rab interactor-like protein [Python bivittatus]|uniref:Ras and Rab interactor-like protein n=1 Tax=Python bivittatus TaxID=176946 RepID=A0A9F2R4F4_PYTBI|nr:ras and Rab interactor-like protein [Python bivittatus]